MILKKMFLFAILSVLLAACNDVSNIDFSNKMRMKNSILKIYEGFSKQEGMADSFGRALYRFSIPVKFQEGDDEFDVLTDLHPVSLRENEPSIQDDLFFDRIWDYGKSRLIGMSARMIVSRYIYEDREALGEQLRWINGWNKRYTIRKDELDRESRHRVRSLNKLRLNNGVVELLDSGNDFNIKLFFFNPLDSYVDKINFVVDVLDSFDRLVMTVKVSYVPEKSFRPGRMNEIQIFKSGLSGFVNPKWSDYLGPFSVRSIVDDVDVGGKSLKYGVRELEESWIKRKLAIDKLEDKIKHSLDNLDKYRLLFMR